MMPTFVTKFYVRLPLLLVKSIDLEASDIFILHFACACFVPSEDIKNEKNLNGKCTRRRNIALVIFPRLWRGKKSKIYCITNSTFRFQQGETFSRG